MMMMRGEMPGRGILKETGLSLLISFKDSPCQR
jgi:hypothetical protein